LYFPVIFARAGVRFARADISRSRILEAYEADPVVLVLVGVSLVGAAEGLLAGAEDGGDEYRADTVSKDTGVVFVGGDIGPELSRRRGSIMERSGIVHNLNAGRIQTSCSHIHSQIGHPICEPASGVANWPRLPNRVGQFAYRPSSSTGWNISLSHNLV